MKTFDNFDFWDLNSLYVHHYLLNKPEYLSYQSNQSQS